MKYFNKRVSFFLSFSLFVFFITAIVNAETSLNASDAQEADENGDNIVFNAGDAMGTGAGGDIILNPGTGYDEMNNGKIKINGIIEQETWTNATLSTGCNGEEWQSNISAGTQTVAFFKDKNGTVHLRGEAYYTGSGGNPMNGACRNVFILPEGYRPSGTRQRIYFGRDTSGKKYAERLLITSDGKIDPGYGWGTVLLGGLNFRTE